MAGDAFQKFKSSVNRGITTISVKTSSTLEKSKIKTHIESLNRDIEKDLTSIGDAAYKIWSSGGTDFSGLFARFEIIKNKYKEVEDLVIQLSSIDERDNQILGNNIVEEVEESTPKYLYRSGSLRWDTESGMWGIFRVMKRNIRCRCETVCRNAKQWWNKKWYEK